MKRVLLIIAAVSFFAFFLSSCTSHERCPAYGEAQPVEQNDKA